MSMEKKTALTKTLSVSEGRAYFEVVPGEVFEFKCPRRSVWGDHDFMMNAAGYLSAENWFKGTVIDIPNNGLCNDKAQLMQIAKNMLVESCIYKHPSASYRKKYIHPNPKTFGWHDSYVMSSAIRSDDEIIANILYQVCRYLYEDIDTFELVATVEHWELYDEIIARDGCYMHKQPRNSGRL